MSEILQCGAYSIVPRQNVSSDQWNMMVDAHPEAWWWHRTEWLDYCLAYAGGTDHSVGIMNKDGLMVGLCPLIEERGHFLAGHNPMASSLANNEEVIDVIVAYIIQTARRRNILTGEFMYTAEAIDRTKELCDVEDEMSENRSFRTRVIDLGAPLAERKQSIRKSYRQFIDRRDYISGAPLFEFYAKLHQHKYGSPRSPETYDIQKSWCENGYAIPYVYPGKESRSMEVDAASLWIVYKQRAYYASGVSIGKNLAHGLTWAAMNDLANRGVRWADLGWQGVARTEREKNIEFFKRGFGGADWHIPCVRLFYGATERYRGTA